MRCEAGEWAASDLGLESRDKGDTSGKRAVEKGGLTKAEGEVAVALGAARAAGEAGAGGAAVVPAVGPHTPPPKGGGAALGTDTPVVSRGEHNCTDTVPSITWHRGYKKNTKPNSINRPPTTDTAMTQGWVSVDPPPELGVGVGLTCPIPLDTRKAEKINNRSTKGVPTMLLI